MPNIIRTHGDLRRTKNVDGQEVDRQDYLFLKSHNQWFPCLNTDTHFLYKSRRIGSSVLCTCGSPGTILGYHAYQKYSSYIGNEVLCCHYFFQYGIHADGSH